MIVTTDTNFCMVFEIPQEFPNDYCFGGGIPVTFTMVDWFNVVPAFGSGMVDWPEMNAQGECDLSNIDHVLRLQQLTNDFLEQKAYRKPGVSLLVLCRFGHSWVLP